MKDNPKVEKEEVVKLQRFTWKELYNCGKDVPAGIFNTYRQCAVITVATFA